MGKSTVADKVIGTLMILGGLCTGVSTLLGPALVEMAKKMNPAQPEMPPITSTDMAIGAVAGLLLLLGGIGMWLGARWGHVLVVVACAISVLKSAWGIISPAHGAGAGEVIGGVVGIVIALAFGGYCAWRLMSDKA